MVLLSYAWTMEDRYFVNNDHRGEREVSLEEYIRVERSAGFNGPEGKPATAAFSAYGHGCDPKVTGRIEYGWMKKEEQ